jgi:hypothetical protein
VTTPDADPLALRDQPVVHLAVPLPADVALTLYHFCLRSGADESKLPVAAARIVAAFLDHDDAFKSWRNERQSTLPSAIPTERRRPGRSGRHA